MKLAIVGTFLCSIALAQPADAPPKFDAADVRAAAKTQFPFARNSPMRNGRYEVRNASMVDLIRIAYKYTDDKILGGPSWLEMTRFDITAKVPEGTTPDTVLAMLQTLLAERFHLVFHKDTQPMPAYALVAGKKPLLKESAGTEDSGCRPNTRPAGGTGGGRMQIMISGAAANGAGMPQTLVLGPGMTLEYNCRNMTMASFVTTLPRLSGALGTSPVSDETGLQGAWNFDLKWSLLLNGIPGGNEGDGITIFDAVDKQLGLKLEKRTVPTPVFVVDKVNEKPTANPPGTAEALPNVALPTKFEVASVKPADPGGRGGRSQIQAGGRVNATLPMRGIVNWAFNVTNVDQVVGIPDWATAERYDITAKAPSDGPTAPAIDRDAAAPMMLDLLETRFGLKYHTEDRQVSAYALTASKPKMKKADPASRTFCKGGDPPPGSPPGLRILNCQNVTMAQFADQLTGAAQELNWPVADATGIEGGWDFSITFTRQMVAALAALAGRAAAAVDAPPGGTTAAADPNGGPTIFEALEKQLGLKLEKQKRTEKVFVIDHLDQKPTEN